MLTCENLYLKEERDVDLLAFERMCCMTCWALGASTARTWR